MRRYTDNEITHRVNNGFKIAWFVGGKPFPVVVLLEFTEEIEEVFWETVKLRHFKKDTCNNARNVGNASSKAGTGRNCNMPGRDARATGS